jgi:hypothetical protein
MPRYLWVLVVFAGAVLWGVTRGGGDLDPGDVTGAGRAARLTMGRIGDQQATARAVGADSAGRQILFGDLHVHTSYSIDAFLTSLPIFSSEGAHPPADACDYARHCAALDFFSINDHAEGLTPERWRATVDMLRACEARSGDLANPDLIPLLGWEWTQVGATADRHWGHKNVVLRGLGDDEITARPIAYRPQSDMGMAPASWQLSLGESLARFAGREYADFMWWLGRLLAMPACDPDAHTLELPAHCLESASTPEVLFRKLDEAGVESIVIPHGLAWGIHAPPSARLDNQLNDRQHDPDRQRLLEVFSGHGNSEEYRAWLDRPLAETDGEVCPEPTADHLACCWRAGEIMRERCGDLPPAECDARVRRARRLALEAGVAPHFVFPDTTAEDWRDCDQCRDCFKPAMAPRAGETAQYSLALSGRDNESGEPLRFRWGFIASSDNHRARASTGFKQVARTQTTDARGLRSPRVDGWVRQFGGQGDADPQQPQRVDFSPRSIRALFDRERSASFLYTGGLVAVHAEGRDRAALWDGLQRRAVYGTSGPRILLWFDLMNGPEGGATMGSVVEMDAAPRFRVRAAGAFRQRPGCPDDAVSGLGAERVASLCVGECYHPGDRREPIEAIEVVRVRPQSYPGEPVASLIDDPWRRIECPPSEDGCVAEFDDPTFASLAGDAVYYVRALQAPTPAINGAGVRARFDAEGNAIGADPCYGNYLTPDADDCLAPVRERAWSSPIFVDRAGA